MGLDVFIFFILLKNVLFTLRNQHLLDVFEVHVSVLRKRKEAYVVVHVNRDPHQHRGKSFVTHLWQHIVKIRKDVVELSARSLVLREFVVFFEVNGGEHVPCVYVLEDWHEVKERVLHELRLDVLVQVGKRLVCGVGSSGLIHLLHHG